MPDTTGLTNNTNVVEAFLEGRAARSYTKALSSMDGVLYSYNMPIAKRVGEGEKVGAGRYHVSNRSKRLGGVTYSNTTSKHIGMVYNRLTEEGHDIELVEEVDSWLR